MTFPNHRAIGAICMLGAGAALLTALGSEWWGGLVPCALCLLERDPYRLAIGLGLLLAVVPRAYARPVMLLLALVFLLAAGLGGLHVGVEQGLWPSPLPECAAPHITGTTMAERLAQMPLTPSKPCDSPTYLIPFLPVSMAAMNLLFALAFALWMLMSVVRGPQPALVGEAT